MNETPAERAVISLQGVTKSYGSFTLGPLDLRVEPGYVVAVVGPNGSGKSTLFRMLMNLSRPDAGGLTVLGGRYPEDEVEVKRGIGYAPEVATGHEEMGARELGDFVSRWYPGWDEGLYEDLLRRFEIPQEKRFDKLSKGMQRRLVFSLAVARGPELLLLDEPTDGVDPFARRLMLEEISRFLEGGDRTVLIATHIMEEVRRIADYVAFLHGGRFLGLYEKDELLESWRALWVERAPDGEVPGLVSVEEGSPPRLVTSAPEKTVAALEEQGIKIVRSGSLDLEEILFRLMEADRGREGLVRGTRPDARGTARSA